MRPVTHQETALAAFKRFAEVREFNDLGERGNAYLTGRGILMQYLGEPAIDAAARPMVSWEAGLAVLVVLGVVGLFAGHALHVR